MPDFSSMVRHIIDSLMVTEANRLTKELCNLIDENNKRTGTWHQGVYFLGTWYQDPRFDKISKPPMDAVVHQTLFEQFSTFDADRGLVKRDDQKFEQGFHRLLKPCRDEMDFMDAIPDICRGYFVWNVKRIRPEAYTLLDDPPALARWQKLVNRMQYYNAMRLMY